MRNNLWVLVKNYFTHVPMHWPQQAMAQDVQMKSFELMKSQQRALSGILKSDLDAIKELVTQQVAAVPWVGMHTVWLPSSYFCSIMAPGVLSARSAYIVTLTGTRRRTQEISRQAAREYCSNHRRDWCENRWKNQRGDGCCAGTSRQGGRVVCGPTGDCCFKIRRYKHVHVFVSFLCATH